jgi:Na+/phosphate symporter
LPAIRGDDAARRGHLTPAVQHRLGRARRSPVNQLAAFGQATAGDTGQRIANAHVLLNVAGALVLLPFTAVAASMLDRLVSEKPRASGSVAGAT